MDQTLLVPLLQCGICLEVADDAVSPDCCDHLFCSAHLARWAEKRKSCPLCKKTFQAMCRSGAAKLARDVVECFLFPCPRSECRTTVLRKDMARHLENHARVDEHRRKRMKMS